MGLYEKMYLVMAESGAIEKNMEVGYGSNKYKAISEAAVLNEVKPLLKKHRLILFPIEATITESKENFLTAKGESVRMMSQVVAKYKIVDIDTGESEVLMTVGNGADTQDKGSGKAWTYAYKALIQKTFCMFSGEDTDNMHSDDVTERNTAAKPTKDELSRLLKMAEKLGYDYKAMDESTRKSYNKSFKDIGRKEFTEIVEKMKKLEEAKK